MFLFNYLHTYLLCTHTHTHTHTYIYIYIHHHVELLTWISLSLAICLYHPSLVGHPTLACLCEEVHRNMSLVFLLLQQCLACLVSLIWMVLEMGGSWLYSCCFVGCCFPDLFNTTHCILVQFLSSFFFYMPGVQEVHLYSTINMTTAWKNCVLFYWIGLISWWLTTYW